MSQFDIEIALNAILDDSPLFPIAWENDDSDFKDTHYLQSMIPVEDGVISIAFNGAIELRGVYQILIMSRLSTRKRDAMIATKQLSAKFTRGTKLIHDDQTAEVVKTYIASGFQSDQWWVTPVSVEYRGFDSTIELKNLFIDGILQGDGTLTNETILGIPS